MSEENQFHKLTQGYDPDGEVIFSDSKVYRGIFSGKEEKVENIFDRLSQLGIQHLPLIETQKSDSSELMKLYGFVLEHKKLPFITYPHEWSSEGFRDAALMQLELMIKLLQNRMVLKDCGTSLNIVFNHFNPVWVDFLSIIDLDDLKNQDFLGLPSDASSARQIHRIMEIHFLPYTLFPLYYFAAGDYPKARRRILETTLNTTTDLVRFEEIIQINPSLAKLHLLAQKKRSTHLGNGNLIAYLRTYQEEIQTLPAFTQSSNYTTYYQQKNEDFGFTPEPAWEQKQNRVYEFLQEIKPETVLDIGTNTGWFAQLASTMGAKVLAADIDEACINLLHLHAKKNQLPIHACVLDFSKPTQDIFSRSGLEKDPHNLNSKFQGEAPILLHLDKRAQSDCVMVLALVHHLCLGLGQNVENLVKRFAGLSKKGLIIEFVAKEDPLIQNEKSFFPAYNKDENNFYDYTQENWLNELKKYFEKVEAKSSSSGRIMLMAQGKISIEKSDQKVEVARNEKTQGLKTRNLTLNGNHSVEAKRPTIDKFFLDKNQPAEGDLNRSCENISESEYSNPQHPAFFPAREIPPVIPVIYAIGINNNCNLRCPLCVTGKREQTKKIQMMEFDLFKCIIDKIVPYAKLVQLYKWGEPFLHKDIDAILEYCNRFDLNTEISSNLSVDKDAVLESIVKHRLKTLIVSFDGTDQESYSRYRHGGSFDLVLSNIKKIFELKKRYNSPYPKITLQYLRNKFTTNEVSIIKRLHKKWGADDYVVYDMTMPFRDRNVRNALEWFTQEEIDCRRYLDIDLCWQAKYCSFIKDYMVIEQDGSIPSCCYATDPEDNFGFWDDSRSIGELFTSRRRAEAIKMFETRQKVPGNPCSDCAIFETWADPSKKGRVFQAKPYVSVIIPTFKRADMLDITLNSFFGQDYPKDRYEIIVADNNSPDHTREVVEKITANTNVSVQYLFVKEQGVHFARNSAAHHAKGEILYFTDDDMIAQDNLLSEIIKPFEQNQDVGVCTGKVLPKWEVPPPQWIKKYCRNYLLSLNDSGDGILIADRDVGVFSCHQAMRYEAFFATEGFHPENTAGEWIGDGETGLCMTLVRQGWKFAYNGRSVTYHMIPPSRMTQDYLNKRLANQGNCDSYTEYRAHQFTDDEIYVRISRYYVEIQKHYLNYAKLKAAGDDRWHLELAKVHYFQARSKYDLRIQQDPQWEKLVLKNDWLGNPDIV